MVSLLFIYCDRKSQSTKSFVLSSEFSATGVLPVCGNGCPFESIKSKEYSEFLSTLPFSLYSKPTEKASAFVKKSCKAVIKCNKKHLYKMKKCSKNAAQTVPTRLIGGPPGQEPIAFFKSGNRFFGRSVSARARPDAPDNLFRTVVFAFSDGFARLGPDRRIPPDGTELKKGSNEKNLRNCF